MVVSSAPRKLTYQDFLRFPEDGKRHEILDGVHVVSPAPFVRHQLLVVKLSSWLHVFVEKTRLGKVLVAPTDVLLSKNDIVEPDLFFISASRAAILQEKNIQGAPDLVIEILSPSTRRRDLSTKRVRYELLGVLEYWVLDPERDTATVFRRAEEKDAHFEPPLLLAAEGGDRLTSPLLPGLRIELRKLFAL